GPRLNVRPLFHGYVRSLFRMNVGLHIVDWIAPVSVLRRPTSYDVEVHLSQVACDLTHLSGANRSMIDARDCADLGARAAEEHLVGQINLGAIDLTFLNLHPQFVLNQLDYRAACNPFKNVVCDLRSRYHSVAKHEEIRC